MDDKILLRVNDLYIEFPAQGAAPVRAADGVSFDVRRGEAVGMVGESGSGKSMSAFAIMGLVAKPGYVSGGEILFENQDLRRLTQRQMERIRGDCIGMVFQNPMSSLNPAFTIGSQLEEALRCHRRASRAEARDRAEQMLLCVGIADAQQRLAQYPHELSGGMRQRVMIAMALMCGPALLIADEPTTGLDVTVQAHILALLKELRAQSNMSILFATHNLGAVADLCDRVVVMYAGRVLEKGTVEEIFYAPAHPYTRGLLHAIPRIDGQKGRRLTPIEGTPANMERLPAGCAFHPRCAHCMAVCETQAPPVTCLSEEHSASCWLLRGDGGEYATR